MQKNYKSISIEPFMPKRSILSRLLPVFLCLSFMWLNLYEYVASSNTLGLSVGEFSPLALIVSSVLFSGLLAYAMFEILLFIYKFIVGFSVYAFLIPTSVLTDKFRLWFLVRNIILGFVFNLRIFIPYISTYLCIVEMIFNMLFVLVLYFDVAKKYIEPLVRQFVFRIMVSPIFIYEIVVIIRLVVGVL